MLFTRSQRKRNARRAVMAVGLLVATSACHKHVPESMTAPPGVPRVGWVIMTGDRDNPDDEFVCQSAPRTDCILPATQPDHQVFTAVHVYFHPTEADTKYTGTIEAAFVQGSAPTKSNVTVKADATAAPTTIVGVVLSTPGQYRLTISLNAEGATRRQIREQIPVEIRSERRREHATSPRL